MNCCFFDSCWDRQILGYCKVDLDTGCLEGFLKGWSYLAVKMAELKPEVGQWDGMTGVELVGKIAI